MHAPQTAQLHESVGKPMIDADSVIVPKTSVRTALPLVRPRLGFLGVGWIGLNRLEAIARSGVAEIAAIADPSPDTAAKASASFPKAAVEGSLENLLDRALELDGLVIATPSALHAEQSIAALGRGIAVFCQKPLGRDARETDMVINAARKANRLLGVDLSYRFMSGVRRIRELIQYGELGEIFAVELVFHNAYGPGKDWFFDRRLSGGGCVIDLGIHLVDLALWSLDFPEVTQVTGRLYAGGMDWRARPDRVEDYASARFGLDTGRPAI